MRKNKLSSVHTLVCRRTIRRGFPVHALASHIKCYGICFCILVSLLGLTGCANSNSRVSKSGFYLDTIITITLYETAEESYIDQCFELADKYEKLFSNTIEDSEISQINANAGSYVTVSDETLDLIQKGISYGDLSGGKFDITLGNLSGLWNFSEIAKNLATENNEADASILPSPEEILEAVAHVDYHNIKIQGNQVMLTDPDSKIDLGGIAKGYIADQMKSYLNANKITAGIIDLGGNILTIGPKSDNSTYGIGVQNPFAESGETIGILRVSDKSVVSSGVYERYYRIDGTLYHHILDVDTGYPYNNELYGVTIISDSSVDGDALSTTCFALGLDAGMTLIESLEDTEAVFVTSDYEVYCSTGIGDAITFELTE